MYVHWWKHKEIKSFVYVHFVLEAVSDPSVHWKTD